MKIKELLECMKFFIYFKNKGGILYPRKILGYNKIKSLKILETLNGKCIFAISDKCFKDHPTLEEIEIPATVKCIGRGAFYNTNNLINVTINGNYIIIMQSAFYNSTVKKFYTPPVIEYLEIKCNAFCKCNHLKKMNICAREKCYIYNDAFYDSSIEEIKIMSDNIHIFSNAFNSSCLKEIVFIPYKQLVGENVIIEQNAFVNCKNLNKIEVKK